MTTPQLHERVLLVAALRDLSSYEHLGAPITAATERASQRIAIVLVSPLFNGGKPLSRRAPGAGSLDLPHAPHWSAVQRLLTFAYVHASAAAHARDRILLDVDVLLHGTDEALDQRFLGTFDDTYVIEGDELPATLIPNLTLSVLPRGPSTTKHAIEESPSRGLPSLYPVVALGGTFDHLHAGHKILLFMAAWISSWKLIVGVTDDALLKNKSNRHLVEDLPRRTARIRGFLELVRPGLIYDIVPISDVAGPTAWDANVQALVVSKETVAGGAAIDKIRVENKLPPLRTFVIDVISPTETSVAGEDAEVLKAAKMSSTAIREWIAQHQK